MKTIEEIKENVEGCKVKLQESMDNEVKFASVLTPDQHLGYQKAQAYIRGWINELSGAGELENSNEYMVGHKNGHNWINSE